MVSKLNIYNVNLKHFGRIRYLLNQYIFNLKFNQGLSSDKLVWKMSKSKYQKQQYLFLISSKCVMVSKFQDLSEVFW